MQASGDRTGEWGGWGGEGLFSVLWDPFPLTLWPVSLLPALGRLCRPTISRAQDASGAPLSGAELARGLAVARLRLLGFHLDKGQGGDVFARPPRVRRLKAPCV